MHIELSMSLSKQQGEAAETPLGDIKHNMGYRLGYVS